MSAPDDYKTRHEIEYLERMRQSELGEIAEKARLEAQQSESMDAETRSTVDSHTARSMATPLLDPRPTSALLAEEDGVRQAMRTGYMERLIDDESSGRRFSLKWIVVLFSILTLILLLFVIFSSKENDSSLKMFGKSRSSMIEDILKLQQTLIDLSLRREEVRQCTKTLTEKNTMDHHDITFFHAKEQGISTAGAMGIGAAVSAGVGVGGYFVWRTVAPWRLRDSATQVPDTDSLTPSKRTPTNYIHGETGDPSEFLSVTPTGRLKKNQRARFF